MVEARPRTIGDLLSAGEDSADAYRRSALARLESCLADSGPVVAWLHGPDGYGKSSLLHAFCELAKSGGAATLRIDCRTVEPTTAGLLGALGELLGQPLDGVESASSSIASSANNSCMLRAPTSGASRQTSSISSRTR